MESKQVLVMKKMPKGQRTGKYCAQAAHASLGALMSLGKEVDGSFVIPLDDPFVYSWVVGRFKKIVTSVDTDQELVEIYNAAIKLGLPASLIEDAGLTEYNGVRTLTAVGIGPADPEEIDKITGNLSLF